MVKRAEFEKELMKHLVPAINHAQDVIKAKYGVRFEIVVDWKLGKGFRFEDEADRGLTLGG